MAKSFVHHYTTTNASFLKIACNLNKLGVKNHSFHMKLYDESLMTVDPFSLYLSEFEKNKIIQECKINPWYFFRECCKVPYLGDQDGSQFVLTLSSLTNIYLTLNSIDHYSTSPVQTGRNVGYMLLFMYLSIFGEKEFKTYIQTPSSYESHLNFNRIHDSIKLLPEYMRPEYSYTMEYRKNKNDKTFQMQFPEKNNSILSNTFYTHENIIDFIDIDNKISDMSKTNIQFFDDAEDIKDIELMVNGSSPGFYRFRKNKNLSCKIFSSNVGVHGSESKEYFDHQLQQALRWDCKYFDLNEKEIYDIVMKNSPNNLVYVKYNHKDLGISDDWIRAMSMLMNNDLDKIRRKLLLDRRF